ncbi:Pyrroline-5-carboxylate reductase [compost metagenome]
MTFSLSTARIAFVGAGSMAEAIFRGLLERQIAKPEQLYIMNRSDQAKLDRLHSQYGVHVTNDPTHRETYISQADVVVLCMKPKDVESSFPELKSLLHEGQLLVSVIAGLSIAKIEMLLQTNIPIVRTMPNTSSTIGLGATGISFSANTQADQQQLAISIFESVGIVSVVDESLLEIVTGVSGSGPAYVYYFMEAMIKAGIEGGLSEENARKLTVQTVLGAASMVKHTQEDPAELRRKVTSPNGSTEAAIRVLDQHQFGDSIANAVNRAAERAKEMGEQIGSSK